MLSQRLRHRVDVLSKVDVKSGAGEVLGHTWEPYLSAVPAEVLTGPGREVFAADAKQAETTARITMRWFDGLLPTMRIEWDGRVYDIVGMETDITGRQEWRLRCTDGASDGA